MHRFGNFYSWIDEIIWQYWPADENETCHERIIGNLLHWLKLFVDTLYRYLPVDSLSIDCDVCDETSFGQLIHTFRTGREPDAVQCRNCGAIKRIFECAYCHSNMPDGYTVRADVSYGSVMWDSLLQGPAYFCAAEHHALFFLPDLPEEGENVN